MDRSTLRHELAARHQESFAWALYCCDRDRDEALDVLQTVYLQVLNGRARFGGRASFNTWLFAVIRRTAWGARRRRVLEGRRLVSLAPEAATAPEPPDDVAERRVVLERALALLPRRQREVVLLVFYHDRTVEEAALVMGVGVGSARRHYARAKARLRELLAGVGVLRES